MSIRYQLLLQEEEFYICIYGTRSGNCILFHHEGGVDVGDVDAKACKMEVRKLKNTYSTYQTSLQCVFVLVLEIRSILTMTFLSKVLLKNWSTEFQKNVMSKYSCVGFKIQLFFLIPFIVISRALAKFIVDLFAVYRSLHFTYLEINPLGKLYWNFKIFKYLLSLDTFCKGNFWYSTSAFIINL